MELVPEDWSRALAIVAHPDDLEYGAASAIARWTGQGKEVGYVLVTSGEAGIDSIAPDRAAVLRQQEQRRSAEIVGGSFVEFLDHADGMVEASIALRRDLAAVIRRHRPEVLISLNFRDWPGGNVNHSDHRAVGIALLDAARDAGNRWLFPGAGGEPWSGVRFALFLGSPHSEHAVDVTDSIAKGVESLRAHAVYLDALPEGTLGKDPDAFLRSYAAQSGPAIGVEYATTFELVPL